MKTVTLADSLFLSYTPSAFLGGSNKSKPANIEWIPENPDKARFVTDSDLKNAKGPGQVAWLLEPWELHPENYTTAMEKDFDAVLTHDQRFAETNAWYWYAHGGSTIAPEAWKIEDKTFRVSLLLSEKRTLPGHRMRQEVAERFGSELDIYGDAGFVPAWEAYAPYQYSVVIENHSAAWYFTERLIDCFSVGTVPIYWGCPDLERFFDKDGVIQVHDVDEIGEALDRLNTFDYLDRRDSIRRNLILARRYAICEDWIHDEYPELFDAG